LSDHAESNSIILFRDGRKTQLSRLTKHAWIEFAESDFQGFAVAQPKTIPKATCAKTLRKDDYPDQLAW